MSVALVVVTDGRWDYLSRTLAAARYALLYPFAHLRIVDDSGTGDPVIWPDGFEVIRHPARRGLAAAVRTAWTGLPPEIDFVWHLEEDFLLAESVDVDGMAVCLKEHPELAQLVLKRQPWAPVEVEAGGIIETAPGDYEDRDGYVEHRRIFSLNPCLIPRDVIDLGWPAGNEAEFTRQLVEAGRTFAFWGRREDPPRCVHIGAHRSAGWKL